ncbi:MAG: hypothetical protein HC896_17900 [Bacteroidales bacterium]|nr:hypothetical protein [Bacteroidales bacterium]
MVPHWPDPCHSKVLFKKFFFVDETPTLLEGWIIAFDSYRIYLNGQLVQNKYAATFDTRFPQADKVSIGNYLITGDNVLAVEAIYTGEGNDNQLATSPGLLFFGTFKITAGKKGRTGDRP